MNAFVTGPAEGVFLVVALHEEVEEQEQQQEQQQQEVVGGVVVNLFAPSFAPESRACPSSRFVSVRPDAHTRFKPHTRMRAPPAYPAAAML